MEDWPFLPIYKHLNATVIEKLIYIWTNIGGLHTTAQILYLGIISQIFDSHYQTYHIAGVILKGISALTLFPLILIIFKSRFLAFLTTIIYSISAGAAGPLIWVVKGGEYLAVSSLNLFLITYYYTVSKKSISLIFLSSLLFLITFLLSPSRLFPIFFLVSFIEIYILIRNRNIENLKFSIFRIICFYIPTILISKFAPVSSCCPFTSRPQIVLKEVIDGNWHTILIPFAGIGYSLLTSDFWKFFGVLDLKTFINFGDYLAFYLKGPYIIFLLLTIMLSRLISKRPNRFLISVLTLNLLADFIMFFIANHHFYIPEEQKSFIDPSFYLITKYPSLVAIYIFSVAFLSFLEWKKDGEKNKLLLALWIGPIFSAIFLWPTWIVIGTLIGFYTSFSWYLLVTPIGLSLFLSAILVLFYEKFQKRIVTKLFTLSIISLIIFILYKTNGWEIKRDIMGINTEKITVKNQELLHGKLISKIGNNYKSGNFLLYLDITHDPRGEKYYENALRLRDIRYWILFRRPVGSIGCIVVINDTKVLKDSLYSSNEGLGFIYKGTCSENKKLKSYEDKDDVYYRIDELYAYKVQNDEFIDIKEELLKGLEF